MSPVKARVVVDRRVRVRRLERISSKLVSGFDGRFKEMVLVEGIRRSWLDVRRFRIDFLRLEG